MNCSVVQCSLSIYWLSWDSLEYVSCFFAGNRSIQKEAWDLFSSFYYSAFPSIFENYVVTQPLMVSHCLEHGIKVFLRIVNFICSVGHSVLPVPTVFYWFFLQSHYWWGQPQKRQWLCILCHLGMNKIKIILAKMGSCQYFSFLCCMLKDPSNFSMDFRWSLCYVFQC